MEGPRILGRHKTRLMYANRAQIKDRGFQTMLTRATTNLSPSSSLVSRDDLKPFNTIEQKVGSAQVRGRRGREGGGGPLCLFFFFFRKGSFERFPRKETREKNTCTAIFSIDFIALRYKPAARRAPPIPLHALFREA